MSIEEYKKLRDEIVSEGLAERPKPGPKRKRGKRPPDAKIPGLPVPEPEEAKEAPKKPEK